MKKITLLILLFCVSLFAQEDNYSVKNIDVNTEYSDFGVTYFGDSIAIYASTKRLDKTIWNRKWNPNNQPYLELYSGDLSSEGEINESKSFSEKINTKYHESSVAFTKDLKTVYFSADNYNEKKKLKRAEDGKDKGWVLIQLYKATVQENGEWSNIIPMPFNNDQYQTGHPTLNNAENKLYFTSDMPGGFGITDIYVVDVNSDGTYGAPKNLGPEINTSGREMFPFISNEDVLYFSSDGHEKNFGELDVYATKVSKDTIYVQPINLGEPINSVKDDFAMVYQSDNKFGHFSSNRDGGKGDDDIYSFEQLKPIFEQEPCIQIANGIVTDKKTGELLPNSTVTLYQDGEKVQDLVVGEDASFSFSVNCLETYKVIAERQYYIEDSKEFKTSDEEDQKLSLNLELNQNEDFIAVDEKIIINIKPIYFDLDKSNIRPDAEVELQTVIKVMNKYPGLIIEGGSHTDSRQSHNYNDALSLRRANSTVTYIINKGINPNRISAKGYGETQLTNKCSNEVKCTEEEHQLNRRTEFVIINPEVINK